MDDRFSSTTTTFGNNQRNTVLCKVKWTKLELVFCVIGLVALVLFVVAAVILGIGFGKEEDTVSRHLNITKIAPVSCQDASCLESSSTLMLLRNTTVDPCDNFYAYACSSKIWSSERLKEDEPEFTVFHEMQRENEKRVENVLGSLPSRTVDCSSEKKIKDFYQSCLDTFGNSVNGGKNFISKFLNPAGGWFALGTAQENSYNITNAMKKVHVDFWLDALFHVSVGPDWIYPRQNTIEVKNIFWVGYVSVMFNFFSILFIWSSWFSIVYYRLVLEDWHWAGGNILAPQRSISR